MPRSAAGEGSIPILSGDGIASALALGKQSLADKLLMLFAERYRLFCRRYQLSGLIHAHGAKVLRAHDIVGDMPHQLRQLDVAIVRQEGRIICAQNPLYGRKKRFRIDSQK